MTMIDALQIDCVELTGPTSGQGVMHLTIYHAQPQGYLNGELPWPLVKFYRGCSAIN